MDLLLVLASIVTAGALSAAAIVPRPEPDPEDRTTR